jgi:hypothetical protein
MMRAVATPRRPSPGVSAVVRRTNDAAAAAQRLWLRLRLCFRPVRGDGSAFPAMPPIPPDCWPTH